MSSVTRFLKQIPVATTYYTTNADDSVPVYFQFNPEGGNYVGNYMPGTMTDVTSTIVAAINAMESPVLRDLGKTFKSVVVDGQSAADGQVAFFRQVQLLDTSSFTTFGVMGSPSVPAANSKYYNIYVAVPITGAGYVSPGIYPIAGGQM
jgi:hypothetical protein